jgi:hypothetical protein
MQTFAPRFAISSAVNLPMPLDAPKTTTTCTPIGFSVIFNLHLPLLFAIQSSR